MRIRYVGHATVLVETGGARFLTDPLLRSRVAFLRRRVPPPDPALTDDLGAVLISHAHHDHLDPASLRRIDPATPALAPRGAGRFVASAGLRDVREVAPGDEVQIAGVTVRAVEALHSRGRDPRERETDCVGYVLAHQGRVTYFAGDTDLFDAMADLAPVDVALLPVWGWGATLGEGHLDPERAARAAALLRARIAVPIHWGTYFPVGFRDRDGVLHAPPRRFAEVAADASPATEVRILEPGDELRV